MLKFAAICPEDSPAARGGLEPSDPNCAFDRDPRRLGLEKAAKRGNVLLNIQC